MLLHYGAGTQQTRNHDTSPRSESLVKIAALELRCSPAKASRKLRRSQQAERGRRPASHFRADGLEKRGSLTEREGRRKGEREREREREGENADKLVCMNVCVSLDVCVGLLLVIVQVLLH